MGEKLSRFCKPFSFTLLQVKHSPSCSIHPFGLECIELKHLSLHRVTFYLFFKIQLRCHHLQKTLLTSPVWVRCPSFVPITINSLIMIYFNDQIACLSPLGPCHNKHSISSSYQCLTHSRHSINGS